MAEVLRSVVFVSAVCTKSVSWSSLAKAIVLSLSVFLLPTSGFPNAFKGERTQILVDQFGYRPQDQKIAVIIAGEGNPPAFEVRDVQTESAVKRAYPIVWKRGAVHHQSGDRVWWLDISSIRAPGTYQIVQPDSRIRSHAFEVREDIYRDVLIAATKMLFYQRSGFAKEAPYADARWADDAAYLGPGQDTEARYVHDRTNPATARDMRGGWFDAGDTNKYVTFAPITVHQLLSAYAQNPEIWTDDFDIPESGNGVPDLLDEIKFELDWLKRMQDDDGGAYIKVGVLDHGFNGPPSRDRRPRYYADKCSSSTISVSSMFAHAAWVYRDVPGLEDYARDLQARSLKAWEWFQNNPIEETDCDTGEIRAADADKRKEIQVGSSVVAAVYLFALTGDPIYSDYAGKNLGSTQPFQDSVWSRYRPNEGDALLSYLQLPDADESIKKKIRERLDFLLNESGDAEASYGVNDLDAFRAYMPDDQYHWGSNQVKANYGNTNFDVVLSDLGISDSTDYVNRAASTLHYFHGVNPLGMVFLTNMYEHGAENSANEMFHWWFGFGEYRNAITSRRGPAPGFVTGGPNRFYSRGSFRNGFPPMKAYIDTSDPDLAAWELTEPSINYQSAYIKLLSKFVTP